MELALTFYAWEAHERQSPHHLNSQNTFALDCLDMASFVNLLWIVMTLGKFFILNFLKYKLGM